MNHLPPGGGPSPTLNNAEPCHLCNELGYQRSNIYYPRLGHSDRTFCTCPIGRAAFHKWKSLPKQRQHARAFHERATTRLLSLSQIPPRFQGATLEDLSAHPQLRAQCERYVSQWASQQAAGRGLYVFGQIGAGKTTTVAALASCLIRQYVVPTLYVSFPEAARSIAEASGESRWPAMKDVELLVLEDIDRVRCSDSIRSHLYRLINHRWQARKPMILSASCDLRHFAGLHSAPMISRIRACCEPLTVPGDDRRMQP